MQIEAAKKANKSEAIEPTQRSVDIDKNPRAERQIIENDTKRTMKLPRESAKETPVEMLHQIILELDQKTCTKPVV